MDKFCSSIVTVLLASALVFAQGAGTAWGQENQPTRLPETVVTGTPESGSLTTPTLAESRAELDRVPGGTTVIDQELIHDRAQQSVEEVLSFAPGVYAESVDNGADARISLRGSGILQGGGFISGVRILRDGLPLTRAGGYTTVNHIDLLSLSHLEVYRGANALEYGAAVLGGAINFVSPTGYTADRLRVGMRGGSDTYLRPYFSSGGVLGHGFDYYLFGSGIDTDGFRRRDSFNQDWWAGANLGYRWSERHETRAFFDFSDQRGGLSGVLFQREVEADPARVTNPFCPDCRFRDPFYRVALKHTATLREQDRLELSASYLLYPDLVSRLAGIAITFQSRTEDVAYNLRHEVHLPIWGRENRVVWGLLYTSGNATERLFFEQPAASETKSLLQQQEFEGENVEFFVQDHFALTNSLTLVPGFQVAHSKREQQDVAAPGRTINEAYTAVSPKFGVLWQATEVVQLFSNVSRSFEPPIAGFGPNFVNVDPETGAATVLDAQRATTIEVGTRGRSGRVSWELAVYHAWVEDELLTTQPDPVNRPDFFTNSNSDTFHSGVELGVEAVQPLGWFADHDQLHARLVYTYNRFRFDDRSRFDDNTLPMIPEHFGNFEVLYEHPLGFYLGINVAAADNVFVDFANTLKAKSYAILGARIGYKSRRGLSAFVEIQNLTDEAYTNRIDPIADAGGQDQRRFVPGLTRSVFVGVEWRWR